MTAPSICCGLFLCYNLLEHVYTSFPEGKIRRQSLEIGGKRAQELEQELEANGVNVSSYAKDMLHSPDFTTLEDPEVVDLVRLKVGDLSIHPGLSMTTDQIYERAKQLGLDLCPAEVGPHMRLADKDQPMGEWFYVGMKQITDSDGDPDVFELERDAAGSWLRGGWAEPGRDWDPGYEFVFSRRK